MNWYENGNDYIGPHQDSEADILPDSPIVSVSFGQERVFRVKPATSATLGSKESGVALDIPLKDGMYVVMGGRTQKTHTHEVPKVSGDKGKRMNRRINITLRCFR